MNAYDAKVVNVCVLHVFGRALLCQVLLLYWKTLKSSHYSTPLRLHEVPSRSAFQFCSWVIILSLRSLQLQDQHVWTQNRDQPEVQLLWELVHFFSMRMSENTPSIRHFDTILVSSPGTLKYMCIEKFSCKKVEKLKELLKLFRLTLYNFSISHFVLEILGFVLICKWS